MRRSKRQRPKARGYTLIELMITVAIIGISLASAWSVWSVLDAPGRPGHAALRQDKATEVLIDAHQRALATNLSSDIGKGALPQPSNHAAIRLSRSVIQIAPSLLRIELSAEWRGHRQAVERRHLTALKRTAPKGMP